jgi:hypothetical protein
MKQTPFAFGDWILVKVEPERRTRRRAAFAAILGM